MVHTADWWLGSLEHPWFQTLEEAIQAEWGAKPLRIREGGVSSHLLRVYRILNNVSVVDSLYTILGEAFWVSSPSFTHRAKFCKPLSEDHISSNVDALQDHAHLPNERISLSHLHRGKSVLERFLKASAEKFSS